MSLGDLLSGAVDDAGKVVAESASNIVQSTLSGLAVEVKTNLGPAFTVGGQSQSAADAASGVAPPAPGFLDYLGIKFSAAVVDPSGKVLYTYGTPPETDYLLVGIYATVAAGTLYLIYRGARSLF